MRSVPAAQPTGVSGIGLPQTSHATVQVHRLAGCPHPEQVPSSFTVSALQTYGGCTSGACSPG